MMTKFGKRAKPVLSNKVVNKIVSTKIAILTRQLAKFIKTVNKRNKTREVCKFDLITQNILDWLLKSKCLIQSFSSDYWD